jgi:hypothetical protein
MGLSFLLLCAIMAVISIMQNKNDDPKAIYYDATWFKTSKIFNILSLIVLAFVAWIYIRFW